MGFADHTDDGVLFDSGPATHASDDMGDTPCRNTVDTAADLIEEEVSLGVQRGYSDQRRSKK
jgi:hypothetical protein